MRAHPVLAILLTGASFMPPAALASDPCERAEAGLMKPGLQGAERARAASNATTLESVPQLGLGKAYELGLSPQSTVDYAVKPGRDRTPAKASGGIARLHIATAGRYSVLLSSSHWVDLAQDGALVGSVSHEGHLGCEGLHKIVHYELAPGDYLLQLSGGEGDAVRVAILAPAAS